MITILKDLAPILLVAATYIYVGGGLVDIWRAADEAEEEDDE